MSRNSALMLTRPVPWPMRPSLQRSRSYHADAVPDLLDYAVGVLGVDLVFDGVAGALVEFMRWDLD